jgi:MFS family permease
LVLAPFSLQTSWLSFWLFLVGAFSGAFYPLGLSILGERIPESGLARANARYLAINCLGSLCGPVITGSVMERFGKPGMFWSLGSYWWSKPVQLNSKNVANPTLAISETQ